MTLADETSMVCRSFCLKKGWDPLVVEVMEEEEGAEEEDEEEVEDGADETDDEDELLLLTAVMALTRAALEDVISVGLSQACGVRY